MGYETVNTHFVVNKNIGSLPVTKIRIAGVEVISLIDCGASVSLVCNREFKKIESDKNVKKINDPTIIKSISGESLKILGCYRIPITIANKYFEHYFYVVDNDFGPSYGMILGYDFMRTNKLKLDFEQHKVAIGGLELKMMDSNTVNQINNVNNNFAKLKTKYILQPREILIANIILDSKIEEGKEVLIKPIYNNNIKIEESICTVLKDNTCKILISNNTNKRLNLNKAMKVANISSDFEIRDMDHIRTLRRKELLETDFKLQHLSEQTRKEVLELVFEFADIFSKRLYTLGETDMVTPEFRVNTDNLPSVRAYNVPNIIRPELKRQLAELEQAGLIQKSQSSIAFPMLMVKKKSTTSNGQVQYRLVSDFRILNREIKYANYPLPQINQILDNLRGSKYYTSLDLASSFFQIKLKPEQKKITTFSTVFGTYNYTVLPQGLNVSPSTMQRLADNILSPLSDLHIGNYIDDYVIPSNNVKETLFKLRQLFSRFREFGLTLNPAKCEFMKEEIKVLGHIVDKNGIRPIEENLQKIRDFPQPKTVKTTRRFLGMAGYYRKFIPNYSEITKPITDLLRRKQKFSWNDRAQAAFEIIKNKLDSDPILIHPDYSKQFILTTDSSDHSIAATLGQKHESGVILPISYFSRKLNDRETIFPIHTKELLAVFESVRAYRHYLYGRKFTIRCDNAAIQSMTKLENPTNKIGRMLLYLNDFEYTFQKITSSQNKVADTFSRDFHQVNLVLTDMPNLEQIKQAQTKDPKLSHLMNKMSNYKAKLTPSEQKYYVEDGILKHWEIFKSGQNNKKKGQQIVIPECYKMNILQLCHQGHSGHLKTYEIIREQYYWTGMYTDVEIFVKTCSFCMEFRSPHRVASVPIMRNFIPTRPFEMVSMDFVGVLPETNKGHTYILTMVDHFSKYLVIYPMKSQSAKDTADKLFEFITNFGIPEKLLTDRGSNFTSHLFQEVAKKLGIVKLQTTAYHPKANARLERLHSSLKRVLSIWASQSKQWDDYLNLYCYFYNNTLHATIKEKPSYVIYGFDIKMPYSILNTQVKIQENSYQSYAEKRALQMQDVYKKVQTNIENAAEKQEEYQNRDAKLRNFKIGQLVYLYFPNLQKCGLPKKKNFKGPYRVVERHNLVNYTIIDINDPKGQLQKVHADRLIPFTERETAPEIINIDARSNTMKGGNAQKTPPQFDTMSEEEEHLLLSVCTKHDEGTKTGFNTAKPNTLADNDSRSDSDQTEIYPLMDHAIKNNENQTTNRENQIKNKENPVRYNLRNRSVPQQLNTESKPIEQPTIVKWLDSITNALA